MTIKNLLKLLTMIYAIRKYFQQTWMKYIKLIFSWRAGITQLPLKAKKIKEHITIKMKN